MGIYDGLLAENETKEWLDKLEVVDLPAIKKLQNIYPGLPEEYLKFLEQVGSGEIGEAVYVIYNGVLVADEIYDETTAKDLNSILIFGDDMQGFCSGFDTENGWVVVEIDPADMSCKKTFDRFSDFIRDKVSQA